MGTGLDQAQRLECELSPSGQQTGCQRQWVLRYRHSAVHFSCFGVVIKSTAQADHRLE